MKQSRIVYLLVLSTLVFSCSTQMQSLSSSEEVSSIEGYKPNPEGWSEAQIAPIDMPNNGHHPNYNK